MPTITVGTGEIVSGGQGDEIRTSGCDPCVGLIVIYDTGVKLCAHFCVSFRRPYTQANINQRLNPILNHHVARTHVQAVGFVWGGQTNEGSRFILTRLQGYFTGLNPVTSENKDSIRTENGEVVVVDNGGWAPDNQRNQYADLT